MEKYFLLTGLHKIASNGRCSITHFKCIIELHLVHVVVALFKVIEADALG